MRPAVALLLLVLSPAFACGGGKPADTPDGHAARGQQLLDKGDFAGAAAEFERLAALEPQTPRGLIALFYAQARGAEAAGTLDPGTGDYWLDELGRAIAASDDGASFASLRTRVERRGCVPCAHTLDALAARQKMVH